MCFLLAYQNTNSSKHIDYSLNKSNFEHSTYIATCMKQVKIIKIIKIITIFLLIESMIEIKLSCHWQTEERLTADKVRVEWHV